MRDACLRWTFKPSARACSISGRQEDGVFFIRADGNAQTVLQQCAFYRHF
jgi:hypothetical protein